MFSCSVKSLSSCTWQIQSLRHAVTFANFSTRSCSVLEWPQLFPIHSFSPFSSLYIIYTLLHQFGCSQVGMAAAKSLTSTFDSKQLRLAPDSIQSGRSQSHWMAAAPAQLQLPFLAGACRRPAGWWQPHINISLGMAETGVVAGAGGEAEAASTGACKAVTWQRDPLFPASPVNSPQPFLSTPPLKPIPQSLQSPHRHRSALLNITVCDILNMVCPGYN